MPWLNYHVYTADVDALLMNVVRDWLRDNAERLDRYFFERHYAGGPHLRLRLRPTAGEEDAVDASARDALTTFVETHPTEPDPSYSAEKAERLLEKEGDDPEEYDLHQRTNVVETPPYRGFRHKLASDESAELLEDFYQDAVPLLFAMLEETTDRRVELMRLGFLYSLRMSAGDYRRGCIGFKSHWSGYEMMLDDAIVDAIKERCVDQRDGLTKLMHDVKAWYDDAPRDYDPVLSRWKALLDEYTQRARNLRAEGVDVFEPVKREQFLETRKRLDEMENPPEFLLELHRTPDYMMSQNHDSGFTAGRLGINLLYLLIPTLGLRPVDKCLLCYGVFSTAEAAYDFDVTDALRKVKEERRARAAATGGPPLA